MFFYTFLPKLLNMSLTASVVIGLVIVLRLLLKKAPKIISYALWGIVLFRLLCPVSIESDLSLFGLLDTPVAENGTLTSRIEYVPDDIVHTEHPAIVLPFPGAADAINHTLPQGEEQLVADPMEAPVAIAAYVWMTGVLGLGIYAIISYIRLRKKLITASLLRDNIYLADEISSPFVMGLFRPKIYIPSFMEEKEQSYIVMHEQHHIRRLDHVTKLLAFAALCIHWFNPLVWVAFIMAGKDMEMSCDEAVVKKMGTDILPDYAASLLSLATGKHIIAGMPLAFGAGDTKGRIRNLVSWKKPAFWVMLVAVLACAILAVCLLTNPASKEPREGQRLSEEEKIPEGQKISEESFGSEIDYTSEVQEWFDYHKKDGIQWSSRQEISLSAFPNVIFRWKHEEVEAIVDGKITSLYTGMPIWSVFFTDLTGDGLPELCSMLSIGSGVIDDRIMIYDYANGVSYSLEDRMEYNYSLSMQEGKLVVTKTVYRSDMDGEVVETGYLAYVDNTVQIIPIKEEEKGSLTWQSAYLDIIYHLQEQLVPLYEPDGTNVRSIDNPAQLQVYLGLHDFDQDGTLELIAGDLCSLTVFTYRDGHAEKIADLYFPDTVWCVNGVYFKDDSISVSCDGSDGSDYVNFGYLDGKYVLGLYGGSSADYGVTINGVTGTLEEMNEIYTLDYEKRNKNEYKERMCLVWENGMWILEDSSGKAAVLDSNFDFDSILW